MPSIPLASAGHFTAGLEAVATAIGAGALVGGFVFGVTAILAGCSRRVSEAMAAVGGNVGGSIGLVLLAMDILMKHVV